MRRKIIIAAAPMPASANDVGSGTGAKTPKGSMPEVVKLLGVAKLLAPLAYVNELPYPTAVPDAKAAERVAPPIEFQATGTITYELPATVLATWKVALLL